MTAITINFSLDFKDSIIIVAFTTKTEVIIAKLQEDFVHFSEGFKLQLIDVINLNHLNLSFLVIVIFIVVKVT